MGCGMLYRFVKDLPALLLLTLLYFCAGKLGLSVAFLHRSASAVWPPTGLALAAVLLLGYRFWPAILAGAFLVNWSIPQPVAPSLAIAIGNTLEALVGAMLARKVAGGQGHSGKPATSFGLSALRPCPARP
jgi:integral membrane sensor domain MASE1